MKYEYDMIVIGGGAAGLTAAGMSALLGAKTALIEEQRLGGDCTWAGCIPSKTLLKAARVAHETRTAYRFGLNATNPHIPFSQVMDHVRRIRQHVYEEADAPPNMEKLGVEVIAARARFTDPHAVEITAGGARKITSRYFVIATGSRPKTPDFAAGCLTNETLFELTAQPKRLLVLGAGPVGIEMAQAFQRLGSEVTVVAPGNRILAKDDLEHAKLLQERLAGEGVSFLLGHKIHSLDRDGDAFRAALDNGRTIAYDAALAAIGREANLGGLQLENAGVAANEKGISVDRHCRTSQRHIFAAGDVTGRYQFTHMAEHMSKVAVTNAILHWPMTLDEKHVVWCTFAEPELARLGESEEDVRKRAVKHAVYRFPFHKLDRAITDGETTGEVKVITGGSGKILGASILGVNAGEMIAEYALAMRNGLRISKIADTIHAYPTYMLGDKKAADEASYGKLDSPLLGVLGKLFGHRGVRRGSAAL
ncbi:MAG: FAD-dependent oxidoreductase [Acidobacteriota bacterium]|nr:FAD-dependent oxidoreductase [Acidobacteriota bacterium]